ncbi:clotting factor C-like [Toxorhynchites rutilus septentrionalis]|uniref:clotting factor C-like n=1 Tax=Toxorhynchites rutilus septentrionalis TaxID=329112 RepID=UPI00247B126A|nr:clotting factor C-like [Toxorhynchites rutilus septentrionalis]
MRSHAVLLLLFAILSPFAGANFTSPSCGTRKTSHPKPLIVAGIGSIPAGQWPWHGSIWYRLTRTSHYYACGATLVSELCVLTAGHCVSKDGNALNERLLTVQFGSVRRNLLQSAFPVQTVAVAEIHLHRDYSPRSFLADIALLALRTKVTVNEFVSPVCLPGALGSEGDPGLSGREAVAVGFGMTEADESADELRQLRLPIVDYVTCLESNREVFGRSLSAGILCAGRTNGSTVCNGDSGGGLFTEESDGRWVIRGVTSFTAQRGWNDSSCSLNDYAGFVSVAYYGAWIQSVMRTGGEINKKEARPRLATIPTTASVVRELRISEKKCKEYRRQGLTISSSTGPGHLYLYNSSSTQGLVYYISDEYAITTADLAIGCFQTEDICRTILGTRIQKVFAHPNYTGGRDYNVALVRLSPATEPLWCLSSEPLSKLYFEGRQLKLSSVSAEAPTWLEFDLNDFIPSKRGSVVYNEHRDIAGLMHNRAGEVVVMTKLLAMLDWIESIVWNEAS